MRFMVTRARGSKKKSRAGLTFKKLRHNDKEGLTESKAVKCRLAQLSVIKRPVLELTGRKLLVEFKTEVYAASLK